MKYRIITIISFIGSAVISLLGGWDKSLQSLIIFMTIDWLTGGILLPVVFQKSPKSQNGALESHAGWKGLCRKAMTLFYVLVGAQLDSLMGTVMVGCALVGALCEWLIVRPSMLERRAMEREAIERRQNAEHEKWKRYQDERHDWEWERDRTIWKDGNEE